MKYISDPMEQHNYLFPAGEKDNYVGNGDVLLMGMLQSSIIVYNKITIFIISSYVEI